jgi:thiol:disulfide interchange protein
MTAGGSVPTAREGDEVMTARRILRWPAAAGALALVLLASPSAAFAHQDSRVRFREYSPAIFAQAHRDGKPVFMLINAVWCYWCQSLGKQDLLENARLSES